MIPEYVYVIKSDLFYKIGRTSNPNLRLGSFRTANPRKVEPIIFFPATNVSADKIEQILHGQFESKKVNGEWFLLKDRDLIELGVSLASIESGEIIKSLQERLKQIDPAEIFAEKVI